MRNLISLIGKNLKIISRSKVSTLLIILAPILIVLLIGTAFNSESVTDLQLGVYSPSYNNLTNSITSELEANNFNITRISDEQTCIELIKSGEIHACIVFPGDLSVSGNDNPVMVHVDNSRINLAYALINDIDSEISSKSSELGIVMVDDLINALNKVKEDLPIQKKSLGDVSLDLEEIKLSEDSFSISKLEDSIKKLESAISSLNGAEDPNGKIAEARFKIKNATAMIEEFRSNFSENMEEISSSGDEIISKVNLVSQSLDNIIGDLSEMKIAEAEKIVSPIKIQISSVSKDSTNWDHLFPTLIALIILMSGTVLASTLVLADKKARSRFRNFMTPTSDWTFIFGTYITGLIILTIQLVLLFAGTIIFTSLSIMGIVGELALILFLSSSVFIFLGMIIGYIFNSDEKTILASVSIISLFIFFSNVIIPSEAIKGSLKYFAIYNPFYITDSVLKKIILFGETIPTIVKEITILSAIITVFAIITYCARRVSKRRI